MSERRTGLVGMYTVVAAAVATVVSPLLSLSYFATSGGVDQLRSPTVSAWARPARDLAGGLLTWASPDRVYGTYWLGFWLLFAAVFLCARAVRARRPSEVGPLERWGWRMALVGYGLGAVGSLSAIAILVTGSSENVVIDVAFVALMLPAILIDAIGSTVLGIALLRDRYRPRITAWLLVLAFPSIVGISFLFGNFSLGLLTVLAAWATTGWRLWRPKTSGAAESTLVIGYAERAEIG
jgi:MFS family permease